jgi:hypothetical protein
VAFSGLTHAANNAHDENPGLSTAHSSPCRGADQCEEARRTGSRVEECRLYRPRVQMAGTTVGPLDRLVDRCRAQTWPDERRSDADLLRRVTQCRCLSDLHLPSPSDHGDRSRPERSPSRRQSALLSHSSASANSFGPVATASTNEVVHACAAHARVQIRARQKLTRDARTCGRCALPRNRLNQAPHVCAPFLLDGLGARQE